MKIFMRRYIHRYNFILFLLLVIVIKIVVSLSSCFLEARSDNYSAYAEYKYEINEGRAQQVQAKHLYYLNGEQ